MLSKLSVLLIVACLLQIGQACVDPDCERLDCGSCGNLI